MQVGFLPILALWLAMLLPSIGARRSVEMKETALSGGRINHKRYVATDAEASQEDDCLGEDCTPSKQAAAKVKRSVTDLLQRWEKVPQSLKATQKHNRTISPPPRVRSRSYSETGHTKTKKDFVGVVDTVIRRSTESRKTPAAEFTLVRDRFDRNAEDMRTIEKYTFQPSEGVAEALSGKSFDELWTGFVGAVSDFRHRLGYAKPVRDVVYEFKVMAQKAALQLQTLESSGKYKKPAQDIHCLRGDDAPAAASAVSYVTPSHYSSQTFFHRPGTGLRQRATWHVYERQPLRGRRVLVAGAGPGGLRHAIEARLNGAEVVVIESRESFTRMNVLHIWKLSIMDLSTLGLKQIYHQFGADTEKETVPIQFLQQAFVRIALVLGVEVIPACRFRGFVPRAGLEWLVKADCVPDAANKKEIETLYMPFDSVVDGTGTRANVCNQDPASTGEPLIGHHPTQAVQMANYAFTANFNKFKGDSEMGTAQTGLLRVYEQELFAEAAKTSVLLQNIVYFRSPVAHYIVGTLNNAQALIDKGVCKKPPSEVADFTGRDNVDKEALKQMIIEVAKAWRIPYDDEAGFYMEGDGMGDHESMAVFEFTKLTEADESFKIMTPPPVGLPSSVSGNKTTPTKCCCTPGPCAATVVDGVMVHVVESQPAYCCSAAATCEEPNVQAPTASYDDSCHNIAEVTQECAIAVPNSMAVADHGDYCQCPYGMQLTGASHCRGWAFKKIDMYGHECRCAAVQVIQVVGDALLSPFWPDGTGANRAFVSAVQHVWTLLELYNDWEGPAGQVAGTQSLDNVQMRAEKRHNMKSTTNTKCDKAAYLEYVLASYEGQLVQPCVSGSARRSRGLTINW